MDAPNNTSLTTYPALPPYVRFSELVFVGLVEGLIGGFGNALVVMAVWYHKEMRNSLNWLIASMSISDFFFIFVFNWLTNQQSLITGAPPFFTEASCTPLVFINWGFAWTAGFHLVAISVNRCIAVWAPIEYHRIFSPTGVAVVIAFCYVLGFGSLAWIMWPEGAAFVGTCMPIAFQTKYKFLSAMNFSMTTAIILVSGLLFFLRVWLRRRTLTQLTWTGEGPPPALSKTEMQVVKMITMPLVINVVTVGFWIVVMNCDSPILQNQVVQMTAAILGNFYFSLNTISYAIFNRQYQQAFGNIIFRRPKVLET